MQLTEQDHVRASRTILAVVSLAAMAGTVSASVPLLASPQRLSDALGQANDAAGYAVAAEGDLVIVGVRGADAGAANAGKVCVFRRTGSSWLQAGALTEAFPAAQAQFGQALAIDGSNAVICARDHAGSGRAWVHRRTASGLDTLGLPLALTTAQGDGFGAAISIAGDWIAVSAPARAGHGAVEIFRRTGGAWNHIQTIMPGNPAQSGLRFGASLSLSGTTLAVGCPGDASAGPEAGAVVVYRLGNDSTWELESTVRAADAAAEDLFGAAVSADGDRLVVGAYRADGAVADAGSVYVFRRSNGAWAFAQKLLPENALGQSDFGFAVAVSGDSIAIGAPAAVIEGNRRGTTYLYRDAGTQVVPILRTNGPAGSGNEFAGTSVSVTPNLLVAGAPLATINASYAGAATVVDYAADCDANGTPDALAIASGAADLNGDSIPDSCQCTGDLNGDGSVGGQDLGVLLGFWGTTASTFPRADINRDGLVTGADLGVLLSQWGSCG